LGKNHCNYGEVEYCFIGKNVACAISVGSDKSSPSLKFKGKSTETNEDAVLAIQYGTSLLLAIADAHFGTWASSSILSGLSKYSRRLISLTLIYEVFQTLCNESYDFNENSETTLIIASVDLSTGLGFGVSFGDSSAMLINQHEANRLNKKNSRFVTLNNMHSLQENAAEEFTFTIKPGEMFLLFTDGVDECHYGKPATSVNEHDILTIYRDSPNDAKSYVFNLANLALKGVNGNPGGQDNVAIAAVVL
jgi:serine/threonine protein phosphatase PrpC